MEHGQKCCMASFLISLLSLSLTLFLPACRYKGYSKNSMVQGCRESGFLLLCLADDLPNAHSVWLSEKKKSLQREAATIRVLFITSVSLSESCSRDSYVHISSWKEFSLSQLRLFDHILE